MQLIAKKPILVHPDDAAGALFGRTVQPGESFEISSDVAAEILIRDGEAERPATAAGDDAAGAAGDQA